MQELYHIWRDLSSKICAKNLALILHWGCKFNADNFVELDNFVDNFVELEKSAESLRILKKLSGFFTTPSTILSSQFFDMVEIIQEFFGTGLAAREA